MEWYDLHRRLLPWREDPSPYHVWLSEIILQQTRVEAGKEYYLRFLRELPDISSLAEASEEKCLKLWEGLGYYSRVRNLHKAAGIVMTEYGGRMPKTAEELQKLPGIGPYTAAAIASMAFGEKTVAVDGNLVRVFSRMTEYSRAAGTSEAKKAAGDFFASIQPADRPGDFNQALMDLGATVCLPNGDPLCLACPWSAYCGAHLNGREMQFPVVPEKKARRVEDRTVFLIRREDNVVIDRRPDHGLLAELYEFPNAEGRLTPEEAISWMKRIGFPAAGIEDPKPIGKARHIFSHIEWNMTGYEFCLDASAAVPSPFLVVSREELETEYSIPSAFREYRKLV